MNFLIRAMEGEYGKKKWYTMSDQEQLAAISAFMHYWAKLNEKKFTIL